jgi:hypothetical protein
MLFVDPIVVAMAHDNRIIEVFLLSYVSNMARGTKRNFALLAVERPTGYAGVRFVEKLEHLLAFDRCADLEMLTAFYREIEQRFRDAEEANAFLEILLDSSSNAIEIKCLESIALVDDPTAELDRLEALYR